MTQAQKVDTLETEVKNLDERVTKLEVLPDKVADIKRDIGTVNGEIAKLKTAVFGDGAIPIDDPVYQDNNDKKAQEVHFD